MPQFFFDSIMVKITPPFEKSDWWFIAIDLCKFISKLFFSLAITHHVNFLYVFFH
jgi:hypothetical protein